VLNCAQASLPHFQVLVALSVDVKCVLVKNPYFNACCQVSCNSLIGQLSEETSLGSPDFIKFLAM
jgi:hypothetical protein